MQADGDPSLFLRVNRLQTVDSDRKRDLKPKRRSKSYPRRSNFSDRIDRTPNLLSTIQDRERKPKMLALETVERFRRDPRRKKNGKKRFLGAAKIGTRSAPRQKRSKLLAAILNNPSEYKPYLGPL